MLINLWLLAVISTALMACLIFWLCFWGLVRKEWK
jgi:hypothetical protein